MKHPIFLTLLLLSFLSFGLISKAQSYQVNGFIRDSFTREGLDSVKVVFLSPDSVEVKRFISKPFGWWQFWDTIPNPGRYILYFSKEGYEDVYKKVNFAYAKHRKTSGTFGEILMRKKSTFKNRMLNEAVVTATRIKMVMKGDTIVYNADAFQLREGSMLDRLITMLPGMELKPGGEIFVNGKKVSSLLVNGEDFFRGDAKVALENLPAYMVDKIKVYEKGPDMEHLLGMSPHEYRHRENPLVVDVNLKRQYSIGWIANATIGGGTDEHYSARGFALRFTPQSRLAFMGYSNNVYGNSYYDTNGNWQNPGGNANLRTHELTSDLLVKDKRKRYKINNTITYKAARQVEEVLQNSTSYMDKSNIYRTEGRSGISRNWSVYDNGKINITPSRQGTFLEFAPNIRFSGYRNSIYSRSADYEQRLAERYMGETLDSLFFDGSSDIYRRNLISSLQQKSQTEGHSLSTDGKVQGTIRILDSDFLSFSFEGAYENTKNRDLFHATTHDGQNLQRRFTDSPSTGYSYGAGASYAYALDFTKIRLYVTPQYKFEQKYRSADRSYYRIEQTAAETWDIDRLVSAKDMLTDYIDVTNSVYSDSWKRIHHATVDFQLWIKNLKDHRKNHILDITLPTRFSGDKLDYMRGKIDTLFKKNYVFFEPGMQYHLAYNDGINNEYHFKIKHAVSANSPSASNLIDFRDDALPQVVRVGNPALKPTWKHESEVYFSHSTYGKSNTFLSFSVRYNVWRNALCQSMSYDAATGIRTYRPDNINGNWGVGTQLLWRGPLDKKRRINFTTETNMNYRHYADKTNIGLAPASVRASIDRVVTRQHVNCQYAHNYYSLAASMNVEWTHSRSDRFDNLDAFNINYRISGGMPLPGNFQIGTNLTLYSRYGYSSSLFNTNQLIWSARISRPFFHSRVNVELEAFDILNKMSSYNYSINAQMQTETYSNVLRRYLMLNVTFRLNKEPKK